MLTCPVLGAFSGKTSLLQVSLGAAFSGLQNINSSSQKNTSSSRSTGGHDDDDHDRKGHGNSSSFDDS